MLSLDRIAGCLVISIDQPSIWFPLEQAMAAMPYLESREPRGEVIRWSHAARLVGLPITRLGAAARLDSDASGLGSRWSVVQWNGV